MSRVADRWERIKTTPGLGRDVTAFVAMVVAGIVGVVLIQGALANGSPFESRQEVKVEFAGITGMNPKSEPKVTMAGVVVGYVEDATTTDRGTALVTMSIEGGHPVYSNAHVIMRPKNPLNDMQVEVNPGGPPAPVLADDGVIPAAQTERPIQADEVLQHLDARTQTALTSLLSESDVALANSSQKLPGGLDATTSTLQRLRPVVDALQTRRANIAQLVTALAQISQAAGHNDERLARLADSTQRTLTAVAGNDDALRASLDQMPDVGNQVRNALNGTQDLTKQLDPTLKDLHDASDDLPPALDELRGTTDKLGDVVDSAAPVAEQAKGVVGDLRPVVDDVNDSLGQLQPVTDRLPRDTGIITSYLTELRAFVYNTRSVFGAGDAQGGIIRGHVVVPSGAFVVPQQPGFVPGAAAASHSDQNERKPAGPVPNILGGGR
jgi:phospholipid/cholesterol/gamma-HCH transport system substrate-binding protein